MRKFNEKDFASLRRSIESGRQGLNNLAVALIGSIFLSIFMFWLVYTVAYDYSIYPNKESIKNVHFWVSIVIIVLSVFGAIPTLFKRFEYFQYFLTIITSQNLFGYLSLIAALLLIGQGDSVTTTSLIYLTILIVFLGFTVFVLTSLRFYKLLKKGEYRLDSKKDQTRTTWEIMVSGNRGLIIAASVGMALILISLFTMLPISSVGDIFISMLFIGLFLAMQFVLPEQLVMLYCKLRFDSFNHNKNGNIKPLQMKYE
ncbi:hypothetical protein M3E13_09395 [Oceanobacillus kimchii]|uniref:hypothetical protein n=1 Tax=Oceanobacillus kimchii TaxID=746691 RepID=UPI000348B36E|nr:hypothetical protein [Oceanobacillus kimchii]MCT1576496.1 hypothetical protein [Oceanobacillus kimchii]MCT2136132.1 hypothetical protein [Oceanobacillus kimchii]